MRKLFVGGQALPDGVMMRSPRFVSKARRLADGTISTTVEKIKAGESRHPWLSLPFIRGSAALVEMIGIMFKGLSNRAKILILGCSVAASLTTGFVYEWLFPTFRLGLGGWGIPQSLAIVSAYSAMIALLSLSPWIRRLLRYHGAEHQSIYAFEDGRPISPESAERFPLAHPRCGTNLYAMYLISVSLVTPMLPLMSVATGVFAHLLLMLLLISVWYEVIALTKSKRWGRWARLALTPGMWFQKLTVRRPDFSELEVACAAVKAVVESEEKENMGTVVGA